MTIDELVRADQAKRESTQEMLAFIFDSHIGDDLKHWRGPIPEGEGTEGKQSDLPTRLKRQYTSYNVLGQVCNDHVSAFTGKDFTWEVAPLSNDEDKALTTWYNRLELQELFQNALFTLLWARLVEDGKKTQKTSSILRAFIPNRAVNQEGQADFSDLRSALMGGFRVMHPEPGTAGMLRDDDGETIGGYYAYRERDKQGEWREYIEVVALDTEIARQEWGFLEERAVDERNPLTVIQVRDRSEPEKIITEIAYPLNGQLTMFEMNRRPFVTESMLEQQMSLNANETYMNMGGGARTFLERIFTNALPPGEWVEVEGENGAKKKVFQPAPFAFGENTVNFLQGLPVKQADGSTTYTSPGMHYHEPTGPGAFTETSEHHRHAIYDMGNMLHKLIAGDATASGVSRQQAVSDHLNSLGPSITQAKAALEWLLRLALDMGAYLSGGKPYAGLTVDPRVTPSAVPPTPDEQRLAVELLNAGIISRAEAMRRVGVSNEDEMETQIQGEGGDEGGGEGQEL